MFNERYSEDFKIENVKQVTIAGNIAADVDDASQAAKIRRLNKELQRINDERDLLDKQRHTSRNTTTKIRLHP